MTRANARARRIAAHSPQTFSDRRAAVTNQPSDQCCINTDKVVWREPEDKNGMSMASIFVTEFGAIGISVAGNCAVMPVREWFKLANFPEPKPL